LHEPPRGRAQQIQAADEPHAARPADRQQRDDAADDDGWMQQCRARDPGDAIHASEPRFDARNLERYVGALRLTPFLQPRLSLRELLDAIAHDATLSTPI
jgi:hypothetical protein